MVPDWLKKYLPTPEQIRRQSSLGPLRHWLLDPALWRLHKRSVSGAAFIGLFCAFLPLPGLQMPIAGLLAVAARCNVPVALGLTWITNPLTFGPAFLLAYKIGAAILGLEAQGEPFALTWEWLGERFAQVWWPLLLGSLLCGCVSGLVGLIAARQLWRMHLYRRLQERREARRARRAGKSSRWSLKRNVARPPDSPESP